jgi:hypothetical protein
MTIYPDCNDDPDIPYDRSMQGYYGISNWELHQLIQRLASNPDLLYYIVSLGCAHDRNEEQVLQDYLDKSGDRLTGSLQYLQARGLPTRLEVKRLEGDILRIIVDYGRA